MNDRRLQALKNLAERPGTTQEGEVAKKKLAEHYEKYGNAKSPVSSFIKFTSANTNRNPVYTYAGRTSAPLQRKCKCGTTHPAGSTCSNQYLHEQIRRNTKSLFPVGTKVYYNAWAYKENSPATVVGYTRMKNNWNYIRLKFDDMKSVGTVPIYTAMGYNLSRLPLAKQYTDMFRNPRNA